MRNNDPSYDRGKRVELTWRIIERALQQAATEERPRRRRILSRPRHQ